MVTSKKKASTAKRATKTSSKSRSNSGKAKSATATKAAKKGARKAAKKGGKTNRNEKRSSPLGLEVDHEVLEFIEALDQFKKQHNRPFPSWSEVLQVLRDLGYKRS